MGAVYRAEDNKINKEVAVKLINPQISSDRKIIERFRQEANVNSGKIRGHIPYLPTRRRE